ncbi:MULTISPECIES: guanylate kinase [Brochothrix]|uniref:Guanylate kinase n=1 Tax=Brochothrix thermosphacta TaxID=2756 RepID=A0A1D2LYA5_BROTH|nr:MULTISPECIES: guanylate kinase [Brochothrix]SLM94104.1 Guanylate kinase [Brachybacterium faecium]ANZ94168.1 guanylate kinase [Brochothrix thermosphacta]ANZ97534.1 guanylate kinase [Brochothrix thermosphacta]ATF26978.1 guanylate kinase [Brochothrix thermosphacta]ATH86335.1 guanylate kinase [Brochothrix thermosphacta]
MSEKGLLFVLSGPSGVGKGTVRRAVFEDENTNFSYSISMTTRTKRPGEEEGVDYYFRTKEEFELLIEKDELLEYAQFVDNYYGTPLEYVEKTLSEGQDVFLEIEVQGAMQVREKMPEAVFIFLTPPNLSELKNRIVGRGTETSDVVDKRMETAHHEIEMMKHYDYAVVNDEVELAVEKIKDIVRIEHMRTKWMYPKYRSMLDEIVE